MSWEVPRVTGLRIQPGTIELWGLIANRTGLDIQGVHFLMRRYLRIGYGVLIGVIFGLGVLLTSWIGFSALKKQGNTRICHWCYLVLPLFICTGMIFSPFWFLGGGYQDYECQGDVIASSEAVGRDLEDKVPPGALIYWKGGLSPAPLLYLDDYDVFPPLLNGAYTLRQSEDSEALVKYGFWNISLAEQWAETATIVLIEGSRFDGGFLEDAVSSGDFLELDPTPPQSPCQPDSTIRIFLRKP